MQAALEEPGSKTMLAPSDFAIGLTSLTDDVLLGHLFEGNLTSLVLRDLTQIVSVNGQVYAVSTETVETRGRRAISIIRIANSKSEVRLTALDVPASAGTVHSVNGVLLSDQTDTSNDKNSSTARYTPSGALEWLVFACALLVLLLLVVVLVTRKRSRHTPDKDPETPESWKGTVHNDDFVVVENALRHLQDGTPEHYFGESAGARQNPSHYYPPTGSLVAIETGAVPMGKLGAKLSARRQGALHTPQPPSSALQRGAEGRRSSYVDPAPVPVN